MATRTVRQLCLAATFVMSSSALILIPGARADGIRSTYCAGGSGAFSCTTQWQQTVWPVYPWQIDARDVAASAERERKWLARCRPVARQDQFGVSRYSYAAAGCEFGKTED